MASTAAAVLRCPAAARPLRLTARRRPATGISASRRPIVTSAKLDPKTTAVVLIEYQVSTAPWAPRDRD